LRRQWELVRILQGCRRGKAPKTLWQELGISRATLYRDLEVLQQAGIPICAERVNNEARYTLLGQPLPALAPTELQLAALRLARAMLAPFDGTAVVRELDQLLRGWAERSPSDAPPVSSPLQGDDKGDAVARIDEAIRRGRQLTFRYFGERTPQGAFRRVDPVAFRYAGDRLYLVAWDRDRDAWRIFKLARLHDPCVSPAPADARPDFDEEALFGDAVKVWAGEPIDVAVRLTPDVAWKAAEWPLVRGQAFEKTEDGSALVRARVNGLAEATRWVLGWGAAAEALEPPELRDAVRREHEAALRRYETVRGPAATRGEAVADAVEPVGNG
jgi:predicted DNA-binding transcriptional regulator YafY